MIKDSVTHIKSKAFAVRIIRFYQYLSTKKHEHILSKQILRSGTSIGANVRESYNAQSKADFINKLSSHSKKLIKHCIGLNYFLNLKLSQETNMTLFFKIWMN